MRCTFTKGTIVDWNPQGPSLSPADDPFELVFDAVDIPGGKARVIGNQGAYDVIVLLTETGLTLVEKTGLGGVMTTTVFPGGTAPHVGDFRAVTSRHVGAVLPSGTPFPSQLHGTCTVLGGR